MRKLQEIIGEEEEMTNEGIILSWQGGKREWNVIEKFSGPQFQEGERDLNQGRHIFH